MAAWKRVPLVVNTQPDISETGNAAVLELAIARRLLAALGQRDPRRADPDRAAVANRPPWLAVVMEDGYHRHYRTDGAALPRGRGGRRRDRAHDAATPSTSARTTGRSGRRRRTSRGYHERASRRPSTALRQRIGYRVRPSWVWQRKRDGGTSSWSPSPTTEWPACRACSGSSRRRADGKMLRGRRARRRASATPAACVSRPCACRAASPAATVRLRAEIETQGRAPPGALGLRAAASTTTARSPCGCKRRGRARLAEGDLMTERCVVLPLSRGGASRRRSTPPRRRRRRRSRARDPARRGRASRPTCAYQLDRAWAQDAQRQARLRGA